MTDHSGDPQQENASDDYLLSVEGMKLPRPEQKRTDLANNADENEKAQERMHATLGCSAFGQVCLWISLNFIRLLRVLITPSVNDSKQSDEIQATFGSICTHYASRRQAVFAKFGRQSYQNRRKISTPPSTKSMIAGKRSFGLCHCN